MIQIARKRGRPSIKSKKDAKKIINSQPKKVVDPSQITGSIFYIFLLILTNNCSFSKFV